MGTCDASNPKEVGWDVAMGTGTPHSSERVGLRSRHRHNEEGEGSYSNPLPEDHTVVHRVDNDSLLRKEVEVHSPPVGGLLAAHCWAKFAVPCAWASNDDIQKM